MAELRTRLVIDGDMAGAKKALEDTTAAIQKVDEAAGKAGEPVKQIGENLKDVATDAGKAKTGVEEIGGAAVDTGTKFDGLASGAATTFKGLAAGIVGAGIDAAFAAVSGAVAAYVTDIVSAGPKIQAAMEQQAALIGSIKDSYDEANGGPSSYGSNSTATQIYDAQRNILAQRDALARVQQDALSGGTIGMVLSQAPGLARFGLDDPTVGAGTEGTAFDEPVKRFRQQLKDGTADAVRFQQEVAAIGAQLAPDDREGHALVDQLMGDTKSIVAAQVELQRAVDIYKGLGGDVDALVKALGEANAQIVTSGTAAQGTLPYLEAYAGYAERIGAVSIPTFPTPGGVVVSGGFLDGGFTNSIEFTHQPEFLGT